MELLAVSSPYEMTKPNRAPIFTMFYKYPLNIPNIPNSEIKYLDLDTIFWFIILTNVKYRFRTIRYLR